MPKLLEVQIHKFSADGTNRWCVRVHFGGLDEDGLPVDPKAQAFWKTFACPFPFSLDNGWACCGDHDNEADASFEAGEFCGQVEAL